MLYMQQPQQNTQNLFNQQPTMFNQQSNTFGMNQNTGAWNNNNNQTGGINQTASLFTQNQPQNGGLFGQNQSQQMKPNGLFGQPQTGNSLFNSNTIGGGLSNQQQSGINPTNNMFNQNTSTGIFSKNPTTGFGQAQNTNFGNTFNQTNNNGFNQPQQQNTGLFGRQNQQQSGGLLGQLPQQPGGLFGQPQQTSGLFGQQPQQQSGLFGQQPQSQTGLFNQQPQQQSGLFGQQQSQQGGLFNQQPQQQSGLFGQQPQQQVGLFGQQLQQQTSGIFGQKTQQQSGGILGQQSQQQSGGLFNQQPQQSNGNLFGQQNGNTFVQQQSNGLFNQQSQQPTGGLFGQQSQQQTTGILGQQPQQQSSGLFGQQPQQTSGLFNQQPQQQTGGIFNQQPQQTGGLLGQQTNNIFGQQQTGGLFGQTTHQNANATGLGQHNGLINQPQMNTGISGGLFNQNQQQNTLTLTSNTNNNQQSETNSFNQQPQTGGLFGQNTGNTSIFNQSQTQLPAQPSNVISQLPSLNQPAPTISPSSTSLFGQSNVGLTNSTIALNPINPSLNKTDAAGGIINTQTQSNTTTLFGNPSAGPTQPSSSLFGNKSTQEPASTSIFGSINQSKDHKNNTSLFSSANQPNEIKAPGLFGPPTTQVNQQPKEEKVDQPKQSSILFSSEALGIPATTDKTSLFGSTSTNPTQKQESSNPLNTKHFESKPAETSKTSLFSSINQKEAEKKEDKLSTLLSNLNKDNKQNTSSLEEKKEDIKDKQVNDKIKLNPLLIDKVKYKLTSTLTNYLNESHHSNLDTLNDQFLNSMMECKNSLLNKKKKKKDKEIQNKEEDKNLISLLIRFTYNNQTISFTVKIFEKSSIQSLLEVIKSNLINKQLLTSSQSLLLMKNHIFISPKQTISAGNIKNNDILFAILNTIEDNEEKSIKKADLAPMSSLPKLLHKDYKTIPDMKEIYRMTSDQLSHVKSFSIYNKYGKIDFENEVDLTGMNLHDIVEIGFGYVDVYAKTIDYPKPGQGLNNTAIIHMYNMLPTKDDNNEKYLKTLQLKCKEIKAEFKSYNNQTGELVYKVDHF